MVRLVFSKCSYWMEWNKCGGWIAGACAIPMCVGIVLGLSVCHDPESLWFGFVKCKEVIGFAVRWWGWWNERRRNGVKDSVEIEEKRNERNAWTKWRCSEWTYRKNTAIDKIMLYFFLHQWKGGGVTRVYGWCAVGKNTASLLIKSAMVLAI